MQFEIQKMTLLYILIFTVLYMYCVYIHEYLIFVIHIANGKKRFSINIDLLFNFPRQSEDILIRHDTSNIS